MKKTLIVANWFASFLAIASCDEAPWLVLGIVGAWFAGASWIMHRMDVFRN